MLDAKETLGYDEFRPDLSRYHFDFGECCPTETNFCQIDTPSDAPYFGIWADPVDLKVTKFIESEVYRNEYDTEEEFTEAVRSTLEFHDGASIDPYGNKEDWKQLGFADALP